jgi:hypothetical protein
VLERLSDIAEHAEKAESGTTKYAFFLPREDDGKTVWVIEE